MDEAAVLDILTGTVAPLAFSLWIRSMYITYFFLYTYDLKSARECLRKKYDRINLINLRFRPRPDRTDLRDFASLLTLVMPSGDNDFIIFSHGHTADTVLRS